MSKTMEEKTLNKKEGLTAESDYLTIEIKIKNDEGVLLEKIDEVDNLNMYILGLIRKDIYENREHNFVDSSVKINFPLTKTMTDLVKRAEEGDAQDDYGLYMNMADAIDTQGKSEVRRHIITETEWDTLVRRYPVNGYK